MRLTAQQIYDKLVNDDHILDIEGRITFDFGNSIQISIKVLTYPTGYAIILTESTDDGCPHQS